MELISKRQIDSLFQSETEFIENVCPLINELTNNHLNHFNQVHHHHLLGHVFPYREV